MRTKRRTAQPAGSTSRFVRRTRLSPGEYRKNFRQLDSDTIATLTSPEADLVTPLMSKIYLRLVDAPTRYWEQDGVLRFLAEVCEGGKSRNAWKSLCDLLGVASATARKALCWMHRVGVIGYFAAKNGVGIRIFINRAAASIGNRNDQIDRKVLAFPRASSVAPHTSSDEAAFSDSYAVLETLDLIDSAAAPQARADKTLRRKNSLNSSRKDDRLGTDTSGQTKQESQPTAATNKPTISLPDMLRQLKAELELSLQEKARQAASREHQRTREWLEKYGLPKAARVAQREAYNVLRKGGPYAHSRNDTSVVAERERSNQSSEEPRPLSNDEIEELAEACIAMFETKGQSIEITLSDLKADSGGFLHADDISRVNEKANALLSNYDRVSIDGNRAIAPIHD